MSVNDEVDAGAQIATFDASTGCVMTPFEELADRVSRHENTLIMTLIERDMIVFALRFLADRAQLTSERGAAREAREALKPFATFLDKYEAAYPTVGVGDDDIGWMTTFGQVTFGDLRRARAAFAKAGQ